LLTYVALAFISFFTAALPGLFWRSINGIIEPLISKRAYGPEMMNFFFWSMFFALTRASFRFLSCASIDTASSSSWLVSGYFGDFSCWQASDMDNDIPLLLFFIVFNASFFLVSVQWSAKKSELCPAYPSQPRYQIALVLVKFLLCLGLVVFVSVPIAFSILCSVLFLYLFFVTLQSLPYLPVNSGSIHINAFLLTSFFTAFYLSFTTSLLIGFQPTTGTASLYLCGVIPVFGFAYWAIYIYLRRFKANYFHRNSREFIREMLLCIANDDMTATCCSYLLGNFCKDSLQEAKVVREIHKLRYLDHRNLFSSTPEKIPLIQWWNKWKVLHFDKEATLEMVNRKIRKKSRVPRLLDLVAQVILKREIDWSHTPVLSVDAQVYLQELLQPDPSVFEDEPFHPGAVADSSEENDGFALVLV